MGLLGRLRGVLFYAGIPLLIPASYGYYLGEGIWQVLFLTALIMMLPEIPQLVAGGFRSITGLFKGISHWILRRGETAWGAGVMLEEMGKKLDELTLGEALALTSLAWIVIPAIGAIPYMHAGLAPVDAFFESMSGWTSTGLSVVDEPENLPQSLLLFRSITQWVGGLGIIILMLAVLRGREARTLLKAEGRETLGASISKTVRTYWKIYLVLSILGLALLYALGMGPFNSMNLMMSGISNGGFFPFSHYDFTDAQKFALAGLMFAGATSFVFFDRVSRGRIFSALKDEELILYVLLTAVAIALIAYVGQEDIYNSILNSVSAIACGGFAIGDVAVMHEFSKYMIILLMICGGMYGSTTGAVKLWRILVVGKSVSHRIRQAFLPAGAVQAVKANGVAVGTEAVIESAVFIFAYMALLLFGAGVFIAAGDGMVDSLFITASSMGNVGLSTFTISVIPAAHKAFLILLMYLGRIEIFPSLALARYVVGLVKR
ncbi:MAG: potassium transporter TrkG [Candidatus Micrarchaeia archaeon]|jgi:trk system potassium uptake protein TrkH